MFHKENDRCPQTLKMPLMRTLQLFMFTVSFHLIFAVIFETSIWPTKIAFCQTFLDYMYAI